jgi:hypothetical protein
MDPVGPSAPEPSPISPDELRTGLRVFDRSEIAVAVFLAAGIAALLTLPSHHSNRGEQQASVEACDGVLCSDTVASAAPSTSVHLETSIVARAQTEIAKTRQPAPEADTHREPAPDAEPLRQAALEVDAHPEPDTHREPAPDGDQLRPSLSAKDITASIGPSPAIVPSPPIAAPPPVVAPLGIVTSPGVVTSHKTGARAHVGVAYAAKFQAYIDDLERNHGARVIFMGGIRPGHCASASLHPCGRALDVCQLSRGVVDSRCHLPPRQTLAQIAAAHGLFEGGRWCNSDYGHAQLGTTAADCGDRPTRIVRHMTSGARRASAHSYE